MNRAKQKVADLFDKLEELGIDPDELLYDEVSKEHKLALKGAGMDIELVDMDGHQHDGQIFGCILKIDGILIKVENWYSSWGSNSMWDNYYEVEPVEKTITVYKEVK